MCGEGSQKNSKVVLPFMVKTAVIDLPACLMPTPFPVLQRVATNSHER